MPFIEVSAKDLKTNPFSILYDQWALVSAGGQEPVLTSSGTGQEPVLTSSGTGQEPVLNCNTMTVSWGMMGTMWNKPVVTVFIRPQRYTKKFVDQTDTFTLSFYPKEYKKALGLLGSKSGRDGNKIAESGLTPYFVEDTLAFEEAHTIIVCRKLFGDQTLDAVKFVDRKLEPEFYPEKDFHRIYFGEVVKVLVKE